uniref:F-box domain-containing protein n=1 Tax=Salmo trutta TaxID=8032 RepID=A0A673XVT3_SALTR
MIITYILSFLKASDRKEASLVCRSWYDASQDLQFQVLLYSTIPLSEINFINLTSRLSLTLTPLSRGISPSSSKPLSPPWI